VPVTEVCFFQDGAGRSPVLEWLQVLRSEDHTAYAKCVARTRRLAALGHELRRPEADYRRDRIHELRARSGRVNYRILYFFHGRNVAVLAHAIVKEAEVPAVEIARAIERKRLFEGNPDRHTCERDVSDA
jgi:hypothetical protein